MVKPRPASFDCWSPKTGSIRSSLITRSLSPVRVTKKARPSPRIQFESHRTSHLKSKSLTRNRKVPEKCGRSSYLTSSFHACVVKAAKPKFSEKEVATSICLPGVICLKQVCWKGTLFDHVCALAFYNRTNQIIDHKGQVLCFAPALNKSESSDIRWGVGVTSQNWVTSRGRATLLGIPSLVRGWHLWGHHWRGRGGVEPEPPGLKSSEITMWQS